MWLLTVGSGNAFSVDMGTGMGEPRGSTTDAPLRPGHDGLELKQTLLNVELLDLPVIIEGAKDGKVEGGWLSMSRLVNGPDPIQIPFGNL